LFADDTTVPGENQSTCRQALTDYHIKLFRVHLDMFLTHHYNSDRY